MLILLAITTGWLYAMAVYLILQRSLTKLIIALGLLSHGANLLIFTGAFTAGRIVRAQPPIIPPEETWLDPAAAADPLPQALILTAIVINFGVTAFALALFHRAYQEVGKDDVDGLNTTDT